MGLTTAAALNQFGCFTDQFACILSGFYQVNPAERGVLHAEVRGHQGTTPYARWGDRLALLAAVIPILLAALAAAARPRGAEAR